ncbi:MAG TPA: AMP-binding protein [Casimicrobiaceae bacterium]|nr:AMP-binding protein [Casimicrobiaceae bacterium]
MTMNAAAVLLESGQPERIALACGAERVTYGALRDAVARAAAAWLERGVSHGDRVAIKLADGCAWVGAYLGAMWAGAVAVAVNPRLPADDWRYIVGEGGFRFILADAGDDTAPDFRHRVVALGEWLGAARDAVPMPPQPMHEESPAFWTHSSGTSGKPKAVVHAHRFALHVERVGAELFGVTGDDRLFASSKLFFAYPLGNSLFTGLKLGATVVLDPQWPSAGSVAATMAEQRPSVLFSVPSLYRNLLKDGFAAKFARQGLRRCVSAGEALPPSLRDAWRKETGITIVDGYGASETLSLALVDMGTGAGLLPAPGVAVQALDPHGAPPMRVRIHTPGLALGYWNRPDADAENFRDGAFCPADLFERGSGGSWRFSGREDSLVKIAGRWVNLIELEQRLAASCPNIAEAAAVSATDADGVAAVALFYVPKGGAPIHSDAGLRSCVDALPPHQRPRWLRALDALPRTATGKLLRRKLQDLHRRLAAHDEDAPPATVERDAASATVERQVH